MELKYIIPFITLFIGGLIGNRLALGRDRRKEYNEVADPIYELLEKQRLLALAGKYPQSMNNTNEATFIEIKRHIPAYKAKGLSLAIQTYMSAPEKSGYWETGRFYFNKPEITVAAIESLQKYVPRK